MMGPTHRMFGFLAGAAVASTVMGSDHPVEVVVAGLAASATAHGNTSPDMDLTDGWRNLPIPKALRQHRYGLSHWWGLPVAAWLFLWWLLPEGSPWTTTALALIVGWASHLVGDVIFGKIALTPHGRGRFGVDLRTSGFLEEGRFRFFGRDRKLPIAPTRVAIAVAAALVVFATPGMPSWGDVTSLPGKVVTWATGLVPTATAAPTGDVADQLAGLTVRTTDTTPGYDRDAFGEKWTDAVDVQFGRNGCDTRNDILRRDLDELTVKGNGCTALTGTLADPFTGEVMPFVRGEDSGSRIHIDHVVSLADAWDSGAAGLSPADRANLANDPRNLWAVDGSTNQAKGDKHAGEWLPPHEPSWCAYATAQVQVKHAYGLSVTAPEKRALSRALNTCTP